MDEQVALARPHLRIASWLVFPREALVADLMSLLMKDPFSHWRRTSRTGRVEPMPSPPPAAAASGMPAGQRPWLLLVVLLIVAGFLCPVVRDGVSLVDDPENVAGSRMTPPRFDGEHLLWYWGHPEEGLYVPLTYMAWGVLAALTYVATPDEQGFNIDPHVFHAASLGWHLLNVALVYALLRRLLRREESGRTGASAAAAAGALFYGLHPLQVEAVAWISGMKDLMYASAALGSILLYLRATDPGAAAGPLLRRRAAYLAGLVLVPMGMLCKPTAMVAPLVALVLDVLVVGRPGRRAVPALLPYLLAAVPLAVVARLVQPWGFVPSPPLWQRPIVSGGSIAFYAWKLLLPTRLAFDYGWRPLLMLAQPWFWFVGVGGLAATAGVVVITWRRAPFIAAALLAFVAALLPMLGLTPFSFQFFSTVGDHYLVLAMLGPAMLISWLCLRLTRRAALVLLAPIVAALGVASTLQLRHWRDALLMAQRMVDITPNSSLGHSVLGTLAEQRGDAATAEREYRLATRDPDFASAPTRLTLLYAMEGRPDDALEGFALMRRTADRFPSNVHPDYRWFLRNTLCPIALAAQRPKDAARYLQEESRLYGPASQPGAGARP
jgi:hypothetical protein